MSTCSQARVRDHLRKLYGATAGDDCHARLLQLLELYRPQLGRRARPGWSERDVLLTCGADQIRRGDEPRLRVLADFLHRTGWDVRLTGVHLLPFCPESSRDGCSVSDYRALQTGLGRWKEIQQLGQQLDLGVDLVLNCTRPDVLLETLDLLLFYLAQSARIVRLDAGTDPWQAPEPSGVHPPQTHTLVRLIRCLVEAVAPDVWILTGTHLRPAENIAYFGQGDEAHLVDQISLPPLLLDAMLHEDASCFMDWLARLTPPPPGATYLNFTASHHGLSLRPLEGLLPPDRLPRLWQATQPGPGRVSYRSQPDGSDTPHEWYTSCLDALAHDVRRDQPLSEARLANRFLATQAVMLSLRGIPAICFHSLTGARKNTAAVQATGQARRINRHTYDWEDLLPRLAAPDHLAGTIHTGLRRLVECRTAQAAFHPDAMQEPLPLECPALIAFLRRSADQRQTIGVVVNTSLSPQQVTLPGHLQPRRDLLEPQRSLNQPLTLQPAHAMWLECA